MARGESAQIPLEETTAESAQSPGKITITAGTESAQQSWEETETGRGELAQPPEEDARMGGVGPVRPHEE